MEVEAEEYRTEFCECAVATASCVPNLVLKGEGCSQYEEATERGEEAHLAEPDHILPLPPRRAYWTLPAQNSVASSWQERRQAVVLLVEVLWMGVPQQPQELANGSLREDTLTLVL